MNKKIFHLSKKIFSVILPTQFPSASLSSRARATSSAVPYRFSLEQTLLRVPFIYPSITGPFSPLYFSFFFSPPLSFFGLQTEELVHGNIKLFHRCPVEAWQTILISCPEACITGSRTQPKKGRGGKKKRKREKKKEGNDNTLLCGQHSLDSERI